MALQCMEVAVWIVIIFTVTSGKAEENTTTSGSAKQGVVTSESQLVTTSVTNAPTLLSAAVPTNPTVTKTDDYHESTPLPTSRPLTNDVVMPSTPLISDGSFATTDAPMLSENGRVSQNSSQGSPSILQSTAPINRTYPQYMYNDTDHSNNLEIPTGDKITLSSIPSGDDTIATRNTTRAHSSMVDIKDYHLKINTSLLDTYNLTNQPTKVFQTDQAIDSNTSYTLKPNNGTDVTFDMTHLDTGNSYRNILSHQNFTELNVTTELDTSLSRLEELIQEMRVDDHNSSIYEDLFANFSAGNGLWESFFLDQFNITNQNRSDTDFNSSAMLDEISYENSTHFVFPFFDISNTSVDGSIHFPDRNESFISTNYTFDTSKDGNDIGQNGTELDSISTNVTMENTLGSGFALDELSGIPDNFTEITHNFEPANFTTEAGASQNQATQSIITEQMATLRNSMHTSTGSADSTLEFQTTTESNFHLDGVGSTAVKTDDSNESVGQVSEPTTMLTVAGVTLAATNGMVTSPSTTALSSVGVKETNSQANFTSAPDLAVTEENEANSTTASNHIDLENVTSLLTESNTPGVAERSETTSLKSTSLSSPDIHTLPSSTSTTQITVTYTEEETRSDLIENAASTFSFNIHTPGLQTVSVTKATEILPTAQSDTNIVSTSMQDTSNDFVSTVPPRPTTADVVIDTAPVLSTAIATNAVSEHSVTPTSDQGLADFPLDYQDTGTSLGFTTDGEVTAIGQIGTTLASSTLHETSTVFEDTYSITSTPASMYNLSTSNPLHGLTTLDGDISTTAVSTTLQDSSTGLEDIGSGRNTPDSQSDFDTSSASHGFTTFDREFSSSTQTVSTSASSNVQDATKKYGASPTATPSTTAFQFESSTPSTPHGSTTSDPSLILILTTSFMVPESSADFRDTVDSTSISSSSDFPSDFPTSDTYESPSEFSNDHMASTSAISTTTFLYEDHTSNFQRSSISPTTDSSAEASGTESNIPITSKQATVDGFKFTATQVPGTSGANIQTSSDFSMFTSSNAFTETSAETMSGSGFATVFEDTTTSTTETTFVPFTGETSTVSTSTEPYTEPAAVKTTTVGMTTNFNLSTDIISSSDFSIFTSSNAFTETSAEAMSGSGFATVFEDTTTSATETTFFPFTDETSTVSTSTKTYTEPAAVKTTAVGTTTNLNLSTDIISSSATPTSETNDTTTIEVSTSGSVASNFPTNQSDFTTNFVSTTAPALDRSESSTQSTMNTSTVYDSVSIIIFSFQSTENVSHQEIALGLALAINTAFENSSNTEGARKRRAVSVVSGSINVTVLNVEYSNNETTAYFVATKDNVTLNSSSVFSAFANDTHEPYITEAFSSFNVTISNVKLSPAALVSTVTSSSTYVDTTAMESTTSTAVTTASTSSTNSSMLSDTVTSTIAGNVTSPAAEYLFELEFQSTESVSNQRIADGLALAIHRASNESEMSQNNRKRRDVTAISGPFTITVVNSTLDMATVSAFCTASRDGVLQTGSEVIALATADEWATFISEEFNIPVSRIVLRSFDISCAQLSITTDSDSSITVEFTRVESYNITLKSRHTGDSLSYSSDSGTFFSISGLKPDTLYDITTSSAQLSISGCVVHTYPAPVKVIVGSDPLPTAALVFVGPNPRVTQWELQVRNDGGEIDANLSRITDEDTFYGFSLGSPGYPLEPNTNYSVRAKAVRIYNETVNGTNFGEWTNFTTGIPSIFGKVTLANRTFNSTTFNESAKLIEDAYNSSVISSLTVIDDRENSTAGFETVHYEIKPADNSYLDVLDPSNLTDPVFTDSFLNVDGNINGRLFWYNRPLNNDSLDVPISEANYVPLDGRDSVQCSSSSPIEIYVAYTAENGTRSMLMYEYNDEGTPSNCVTELNLTKQGENYIPFETNTVYGVGLVFFKKVLPRSRSTDELLYTRMYEWFDTQYSSRRFTFYDKAITAADLDTLNVRYSVNDALDSAILTVPNVPKSVMYEVMNGSDVIATLNEIGIDGSADITMEVSNLPSNTLNELTLRVSTRTRDGSIASAATSLRINTTTSTSTSSTITSNPATIDASTIPFATEASSSPATIDRTTTSLTSASSSSPATIDATTTALTSASSSSTATIVTTTIPFTAESSSSPATIDITTTALTSASSSSPATIVTTTIPFTAESSSSPATIDRITTSLTSASSSTPATIDTISTSITSASSSSPATIVTTTTPFTAESSSSPATIDTTTVTVTTEAPSNSTSVNATALAILAETTTRGPDPPPWWVILLIVLGVVGFLVLFIGILWYCWGRRLKKSTSQSIRPPTPLTSRSQQTDQGSQDEIDSPPVKRILPEPTPIPTPRPIPKPRPTPIPELSPSFEVISESLTPKFTQTIHPIELHALPSVTRMALPTRLPPIRPIHNQLAQDPYTPRFTHTVHPITLPPIHSVIGRDVGDSLTDDAMRRRKLRRARNQARHRRRPKIYDTYEDSSDIDQVLDPPIPAVLTGLGRRRNSRTVDLNREEDPEISMMMGRRRDPPGRYTTDTFSPTSSESSDYSRVPTPRTTRRNIQSLLDNAFPLVRPRPLRNVVGPAHVQAPIPTSTMRHPDGRNEDSPESAFGPQFFGAPIQLQPSLPSIYELPPVRGFGGMPSGYPPLYSPTDPSEPYQSTYPIVPGLITYPIDASEANVRSVENELEQMEKANKKAD